MVGPMGRLEARFNALRWLPEGSRLTVRAMVRYDSVRGTHAYGLVGVRIPLSFARKDSRRRHHGFDARMDDQVVRNWTVTTQAKGLPEAAFFEDDGEVESVRFTDGAANPALDGLTRATAT
jgi:hypothetical protein